MAKTGPKRRFETKADKQQDALPGSLEIPLTPTQKSYRLCDKIYKAIVGGVGCGKSFGGCYDAIVNTPPGAPLAVVSATYRMLEDTTQRSFIEVAEKLGLWPGTAGFRKTDNIAILNNGAEVFFRSGDDPDKLSGLNLARVYLDEASLMKEMVFTISVARLRWRGEQGRLSATFTPRGKEHWTYRLFGDKKNPNVQMFHCSTKDNKFLSPAFYENLLLQYGKGEGGQLRALQDLEGEFVCVEGSEWDATCFSEGKFFHEWPQDEQAIRVVMLDSSKGIGGKTGDFACFSLVQYSGGKLWCEAIMDNRWNFSDIAARAVTIQKAFNPVLFGIEEEFGGTAIADDFLNRADGAKITIPVMLVPTHKVQKEVRIRMGLSPYLGADMLRWKNTDMTRHGVAQMEAFPGGEHDDFPDALAGAIRLINESGLVVIEDEGAKDGKV